MKNKIIFLSAFCMSYFLSGCDSALDTTVDEAGHSAPTEITAKANNAVLASLPFSDKQDFEDAQRGLIASVPSLEINDANGTRVWDLSAYDFIKGEAPSSVNPSLWRQARLNNIQGLFKVTDGIYQLRGFDLANMTLIEGKTGWIVVDPLTTAETASAAMNFASQHLGDKPIVAVIYSHSHIDHFGGVNGLVSKEQVARKTVRVISPEGFMEEATSENIIAGAAMARRAMFMYGKRLPVSERGHVSSGLGISPAFGSFGIIPPTEIVDKTGHTMEIDGVEFVFQMVNGTEAPSEFTFYLPEYRAFCGAEMVSRTMHNMYTLRGAKVRDVLKWSNLINEALDMFGEADVYFGTHHWPIWGNQRIAGFLENQRDTYKYIHDQSVRLLNAGLTSREIAEKIQLPPSLNNTFSNRGYYGTVKHNTKAVYQGYMGWYDGNPANLDPLPPAESAVRYMALMGGEKKVLERAQKDFEQGEYRWVAELLNHLVFAEPDSEEARQLLARTYDQLGYQSESGPWRDVYLSAAYELRHGAPEEGIDLEAMAGVLKETPNSYFFDSMAVRLIGPDAEGKELKININFTDMKENYVLIIENAVLHHRKTEIDKDANATLNLTREMFLKMVIGTVGIKDVLFSDEISLDGSKLDLISFFSLFEKPTGTFNIVTP